MRSRTRTHKTSLQSTATRTALLLVFAVSLATSGFVLSANGNERKTAIITFDVPGAVNGTLAIAINPGGTIAGLYIDSVAGHGYVRSRDGSFITFDVPGAGPDKGQCESINPAGTITGIYNTGVFPILVAHGFVRARDGTITTLDVPGAGTGSFQGTYALNINPAGTIAGDYADASNVYPASFAPLMVPSPRSTLRARAQAPARGPLPHQPVASTRQARSWEVTLMRVT